MANANKIGVCMDNTNAHLIEYTTDPVETITLQTDFSHAVTEDTTNRSLNMRQNKVLQEQAYYYKQLGAIIKNYKEVILFGPADAKVELFNVLRSDHHFENVIMKVHQSDTMTESQQHAFVRTYFSKPLNLHEFN